MESTSSASPLFTNSLDRALSLLEALETAPAGLTNADLCRLLQIPSSTCTYITSHLEKRGFVRRDVETRRYRIGLKTVALARCALRDLGFRSIAEPVLYRLTSETGLSAGIGVRQGTVVLMVDRVEGPDVVEDVVQRPKPYSRSRDNRDVGREMPLHSTALGKILMAYLPAAERRALLSDMRFERLTQATIVDLAELERQLELIERQGYAEADQEQFNGLRSVSAPIFDATHRVRAAISLNGSITAKAWLNLPALVERLTTAAHEISRQSRFSWLDEPLVSMRRRTPSKRRPAANYSKIEIKP